MEEQHFRIVAKYMLEGKVVPFLGAGVHYIGRAEGQPFELGTWLPSGKELARHLADVGEISMEDGGHDLARVSQTLAMLTGEASLYDELRSIFNHDYPPTTLHALLAELPSLMRAAGRTRYPFIVTTNYDCCFERAMEAAGEPFDLVIYIADGPNRGRFLHRDPDGNEEIINEPNRYDKVSLDARPVVAKIHGAVDRMHPESDSYVITEDHYIDYLTRTDLANLVPVKLVAQIQRSHFLFLGYSLKDWNLRVILHRIWGSQKLHYKSWSVQHVVDPIEQQSWAQRDVQIMAMPLGDYLDRLRDALHAEVGVR